MTGKSILLLKEILVVLSKRNKVVIKELPQGRLQRLLPLVYLHIAAVFHIAPSDWQVRNNSSGISHSSHMETMANQK